MEKCDDPEVNIREEKDAEKGIYIVNGANTVVKNVTVRRHQDSEMNDAHLEGYLGNVKRHPDHVIFNTHTNGNEQNQLTRFSDNQISGVQKIVLSDIERANREHNTATGIPGIMDQKLGPTILSGGLGSGYASSDDDVIVKLVPSSYSAEQDFMIEAEAISLVNCKLLQSEEEHEQFDNLILKPVYWSELKLRQSRMTTRGATSSTLQGSRGDNNSAFNGSVASKSVHNHPLQSTFYHHMMSLTMCFTSQSEGYLYHLPGHLR